MSEEFTKHDQVLMSLAMNLQQIAMVQLGKLSSPASGEVERDLEGARGTIDILEMLKVKCRTGTPGPVVKLLDQAVMDLQMNYLDELKRQRREQEQASSAASAAAGAGDGAEAAAPAGEAADQEPAQEPEA
jgi:hypothetical protein